MTEEMFYIPKEEMKNVDKTRAAVVGYSVPISIKARG